MLDVRVQPLAVRNLLGAEAQRVTDLLHAVPADVPLWDATDAHLSAAEAVWNVLRGQPGIDWVTAGKLLARKRPLLVPVYDSVIRDALRPPSDQVWVTLGGALGDERRRVAIEALRPPGLTPKVTTLRLLDVAVWMRHSDGTNARLVQQRVGIEVSPRA